MQFGYGEIKSKNQAIRKAGPMAARLTNQRKKTR